MQAYEEQGRRWLNALHGHRNDLNNVAPICNHCAIGKLRQRVLECVKEYRERNKEEIEEHDIMNNRNHGGSREIVQSMNLQENT